MILYASSINAKVPFFCEKLRTILFYDEELLRKIDL